MCQMIVGIVIHILDHIWTMIPKHISFSLYKYFGSIKNLAQNGQIPSFFYFSSLKPDFQDKWLIQFYCFSARYGRRESQGKQKDVYIGRIALGMHWEIYLYFVWKLYFQEKMFSERSLQVCVWHLDRSFLCGTP